MIKKIAIGFLVVVGLFMLYVAIQPSDFSITRELSIKASAESIFPLINNSEKANSWMPWKASDPNVKMEFSGPSEGVGSKSFWNSTGQMGTGEALVVESVPNQLVKTQLVYSKPFEMSQMAEVSLAPGTDGSTVVRWTVTGKNNFMGRLFCVFMDMDKIVGSEFEKGLNNLKSLVETK